MSVVIKADNEIVFRDVRGNTDLLPRTYTGIFGGYRNDESLDLVYVNTITVNKDLSLPGSPPYKVVAFNTSDISQVKVNVANTPIAMQASSEFSSEAIINPLLNVNSLNQFNFQVFSSLITSPFFTIPNNHPNAKSYTWGFELRSSLGRIYYNRDGQRENLDITSFNGQSVGSGARFNQPHNSLGEQVLDDILHLFVH